MQKTIKNTVALSGIGLHSGRNVELRIRPAAADHGIVFVRVDLPTNNRIAARFDRVSDTLLNTRISNGHAEISTIEHLMAAFAGLGIHNALVEVNGAEVPVLDGSSREFVRALLGAGIRNQDAAIHGWRVIKNVRVDGRNGAFAELIPSERFILDVTIDFAEAAIGKQSLRLDMENGAFLRELSDCRTFTIGHQVDFLKGKGLALGGSLKNAVVIDGRTVRNPEGFRRNDECVRHKMLDALGDLSLAGGPLLGEYRGYMSGHALTNQLLHKAFETYALAPIVFSQEKARLLPGYVISEADIAAA